MHRLPATAVAASMLFATSAGAQPANMTGYGFNSCRDIVALAIQDQPRMLEVMQWVFGYMSGLNTMNIVEHKRFRDIGAVIVNGQAGSVTVPLLRSCREDPGRVFAEVVGEFYSGLPLRNFKQ